MTALPSQTTARTQAITESTNRRGWQNLLHMRRKRPRLWSCKSWKVAGWKTLIVIMLCRLIVL